MTKALDRILNVALIGAGEIAMTTHLPTLLLCSHLYRTVALVDISKQTLAHCAHKFHVPATYTNVEMLEKSPEVDVVFIMNANEYHVLHTVQCLKAGKHVMVEKPMSLTKEGADEIEAARQASGKVVFVGYMRRYAHAFLRVKEMVDNLPEGAINYVRVRDIIGWNSQWVDQCAHFPAKFTDFPPEANQERLSLNEQQFQQAIGKKASNPLDKKTYFVLNVLASHDVSAMRELLGMPTGVVAATRNAAGSFTHVIFEYPGFKVYLEFGVDNVMEFDAQIEIYASDRHITLQYDSPYIKGLPITAKVVGKRENGDHYEELIRPSYEDAYTLEYKALHDAIVKGTPVKNDAVDAKQDLEIFDMVMKALV
uniref:Gfo/Idh/MocA-like oxidoreductase N-terminal domain-containing protein n=1 Tax=Kwoniella dejecticola CBS 10117 TaxID=1296121 RepID=A0A1A6AHR9_9TREE|nr:uncharacterized protein I303_01454 [Kwoniella dejecticola CBS 10117]OBR89625.1 hypothetical protein I303_01454 [Kwoniella dejecticola CBS 10117]